MQKSKTRKDRLFIMVSALVVASLSYNLIRHLWGLFEAKLFACIWCWAVVIANVIAIIGMLWLLQNYRRRRRLEQAQAERRRKQTGD